MQASSASVTEEATILAERETLDISQGSNLAGRITIKRSLLLPCVKFPGSRFSYVRDGEGVVTRVNVSSVGLIVKLSLLFRY